MDFSLHPNFAKKIRLADWQLSTVLLENEKPYPWVILVPKRAGVRRLMDLSFEDRVLLMEEIDRVERALFEEFKPDQTNVCQIGIKTPQLHIHVIARFKEDASWPGTVFENSSTSWPFPFDRKDMEARLLKRLGSQIT